MSFDDTLPETTMSDARKLALLLRQIALNDHELGGVVSIMARMASFCLHGRWIYRDSDGEAKESPLPVEWHASADWFGETFVDDIRVQNDVAMLSPHKEYIGLAAFSKVVAALYLEMADLLQLALDTDNFQPWDSLMQQLTPFGYIHFVMDFSEPIDRKTIRECMISMDMQARQLLKLEANSVNWRELIIFGYNAICIGGMCLEYLKEQTRQAQLIRMHMENYRNEPV